MYERILATTAALLAVGATYATTMYAEEVRMLEPLPDSGQLACTWDLHVDIADYAGNDWWGTGLYVTVTGGTFFQSADNDGDPPDPGLFGDYPVSEWTSFYTGPGAWPNAAVPDYPVLRFAEGPDETLTSLDAAWFDLFHTGAGDFVIARMTVIPDNPLSPSVHIEGLLETADGGQAHDYFDIDLWCIPEPGALGMLAIGALMASRRRSVATSRRRSTHAF